MKITTLLGFALCAMLTLNSANGQGVPSKINYQAVARNAAGATLQNQNVSIRFTIHSTSTVGPVVYQETHALKTNQLGLFNTYIGGGTVIQGTWAAIPWATADIFLRVEMDAAGGINFTDMGTTQFVSVPYAMQSATAASANSLSATATGVVRSINGSGGALTLQGGGGTTISKTGDVITISSSGGSGGTGIQGVQNTDGILQITNPNGPSATININNASIPASKLVAGVIPTALPPIGNAGGDLTGTYPNPTIGNGSVTAAKLAPGVIPTTLPPSGTAAGDLSGTYPNPGVAKIQGRAIAATAPTAGQVLAYDGTQWAPSAGSSGWSLTGNTATNPATNYLGTSDNQPLIVRTNNVERLRVLGTGNVGIGTTSPTVKLEVSGGSMAVRNTTSDAILLIDNPANTNEARLEVTKFGGLGSGSVGFYPGSGDLHLRSVPTGTNLVFDVAAAEKMRITPTGNVGIGTTAPSAKLDVNGEVRVQTTTQNPVKNTMYGNSAPIAYGTYTNALFARYGVASVTKTSEGEFRITLQNAAGYVAVMVTPWDWNVLRIYSWYQEDPTRISVKFFTTAGVAADPSGFSFVIFGNLQ